VITGSEDLHSCVTDRGIKIVRSPLSPGSQVAATPSTAGQTPTSSSSLSSLSNVLKIPRLSGQNDVHSLKPTGKAASNTSHKSTLAVAPLVNSLPAVHSIGNSTALCSPVSPSLLFKPISTPPSPANVCAAPTTGLANNTSTGSTGDEASHSVSLAKQHAKKSASINQIVNKIASSRIGKTVPVSASASFPFLNSNTLPKSTTSASSPSKSIATAATKPVTSNSLVRAASIALESGRVEGGDKLDCTKNDPLVIRIAKSGVASKPLFGSGPLEVTIDQGDSCEKRPHSSNALFTDDNDDDDDDDEGKLVLIIPDQSDHETSELDESNERHTLNKATFGKLSTSTGGADNVAVQVNGNKSLLSSANTPPSSSPDLQLKFGRNGCEIVNRTSSVKPAHQNAFAQNTLLGGTVSPPQTPSPKPCETLDDVLQPKSNNFGALDLTTGKSRNVSISSSSPTNTSTTLSVMSSCQLPTQMRALPDHSIVS
jgi:hypothetical protein